MIKNKKALQQNARGLGIVWLPGQDEFRNFCMRDKKENICHKL